jgi:hypothetical protein
MLHVCCMHVACMLHVCCMHAVGYMQGWHVACMHVCMYACMHVCMLCVVGSLLHVACCMSQAPSTQAAASCAAPRRTRRFGVVTASRFRPRMDAHATTKYPSATAAVPPEAVRARGRHVRSIDWGTGREAHGSETGNLLYSSMASSSRCRGPRLVTTITCAAHMPTAAPEPTAVAADAEAEARRGGRAGPRRAVPAAVEAQAQARCKPLCSGCPPTAAIATPASQRRRRGSSAGCTIDRPRCGPAGGTGRARRPPS